MWLMLQQGKPDDYVIATGETHSVREFVNLAFSHAGIELEWVGSGPNEKGIVKSFASNLQPLSSNGLPPHASNLKPQSSSLRLGEAIIEIDPRYLRPLEVEFLKGDASKAKKKLKWEPRVKFKDLVRMMVDADIKELEEMRRCQDVIRKLSNNKK